ncbi:MAG TPA: hypothetical protein VIH82_10070 [Acidimicrobiia bacterium]|jgi:hypothetical protein
MPGGGNRSIGTCLHPWAGGAASSVKGRRYVFPVGSDRSASLRRTTDLLRELVA